MVEALFSLPSAAHASVCFCNSLTSMQAVTRSHISIHTSAVQPAGPVEARRPAVSALDSSLLMGRQGPPDVREREVPRRSSCCLSPQTLGQRLAPPALPDTHFMALLSHFLLFSFVLCLHLHFF